MVAELRNPGAATAFAKLRPTPGRPLYSLPRTFKNRQIAVEVPQRMQNALIGHAVHEVLKDAHQTLRDSRVTSGGDDFAMSMVAMNLPALNRRWSEALAETLTGREENRTASLSIGLTIASRSWGLSLVQIETAERESENV